ncbi:MAG: polysaccharide deacetylase family protein [Jatrophihabitantaceae bacterium]
MMSLGSRLLVAALVFVAMPVTGVGSRLSASAATGCAPVPGGVRFAAPGTGRTVALTFDDGPGRDTGRIMAILAANRVTATFFNVGVSEARDPATVRAEQAGGYALGGHTWDHASLPTLSAAGQASEIDRERVQQAATTGRYPCLFRPPYGTYNSTTLTLAQQRGMAFWYWSVDTEDWKAAGSGDPYWVSRIASRAEAGASQLHPVILMHNQPAGNPATVAALPAIISYYRSHGYTFVDLFGRSASQAPSIRWVAPSSGKTSGGTRVAIAGTGFTHVTGVRFAGAPGMSIQVVSDTRLYVTTTAHTQGTINVQVVTTHGTSPITRADYFTYVARPVVRTISPKSGPTAGGMRVAVLGSNFRQVTSVRFGSVPGTDVRVYASWLLYVTSPAHVAGVVGVQVITSYGVAADVPLDHYTYVAPP